MVIAEVRTEVSLPEFKEAKQPGEIVDATKATAHLPGLEIEIVHRRSPTGDNEQISINLQAVPSFEAFGRFLEAANPFAFWAIAWSPWIDTARAMMLPWRLVPLLPTPGSEAVPHSSGEPHSS
jgi:hypothetical protein